MKQTWKWAMMLFMALTVAIGTTSCSSDDDDEDGNTPSFLVGKWVLVYEQYKTGDEVEEYTYNENNTEAFWLFTEKTLTFWFDEDEYEGPYNVINKNGIYYLSGTDDWTLGKIVKNEDNYVEFASQEYDDEEDEMCYIRQGIRRISKFPWE